MKVFSTLEKKHPRLIRWCHWIHFPLLAIMIWSGLMIYWANAVYRIGVGDRTIFHFFPQSVYRFLSLDHHLAFGMALHFFFMWLFFMNGALYVVWLFYSGEWKNLTPNRNSFRESIQVLLHDLHISKNKPSFIKYNAAQRIAYTGIIIVGVASLVTGLAIYKPIQFPWLTSLLGGYEWARFEHFWLMMGYCLFFLIHVLQVFRAGWNNFRSMVTGYEIKSVKATTTSSLDEKP